MDKTLESESSGSHVVNAVVNKIQDLFDSDNQFLRRIAFMESQDGTAEFTHRSDFHGGIWQVDEATFSDTQNTTKHPELTSQYQKIMEAFKINWLNITWEDLRVPLYSGLAARLFFSYECELNHTMQWQSFGISGK